MATTPQTVRLQNNYLEADRSCGTIAATSVMVALTLPLLAARIYVRTLTNATRGWDEFLLPLAWLGFVGLAVCAYLLVPWAGLGRHVEVVKMEDPHHLVLFSELLYILDWFYVPSNMLSRISVVFFYLRIFTNRIARISAWVIVAFLISNCVGMVIAAQFECTPLTYTWNKSITGGHCFNQELWYQLGNVPNVTADVAILVLPMPTIWTIKASRTRRAGIAIVCLMGSIGLVASCVRLSQFIIQDNSDPTWAGAPLISWTVVECGMYFSAACLVGLRPLLSRTSIWVKTRLGHVSRIRGSGHSAQTSEGDHPTKDVSQFTTIIARSDGLTNDSQARIVKRDGDLESGGDERYSRRGLSDDIDGIYVRTSFEVEQAK